MRVILRAFDMVEEPAGLFDAWFELCREHDVRGRQVYDARLAAMMSVAGITEIMTFNATDFSRFRFLKVSVPGKG